jgi:hypothetical protein
MIPSDTVMENDTGAVMDALLAAVPLGYRARVRARLTDPRAGGRGLRAMLALLDTDPRALPDALPTELVEVYLRDDEAEPLHDCERCGLPVPVHAGRRCGHEASVDREYFPACPHCGGRTGRFAFWSSRHRSD